MAIKEFDLQIWKGLHKFSIYYSIRWMAEGAIRVEVVTISY
jgi:hypothetical protein